MKLLIGIPCLDQINVSFVRCLRALEARLRKDGIEHDVIFASGTLVYLAREKIVEKAVKEKFTHVLWIDSDMVFAEDVFEKLAQVDAPFVCGLFRSRHEPYGFVIFDKANHAIEIAPKYPFKIVTSGFGGVLTETALLEAVAKANGGRCFTPTVKYGEDYQFCERVRDLGARLMCQPLAPFGHTGQVVVWPEKIPRMG